MKNPMPFADQTLSFRATVWLLASALIPFLWVLAVPLTGAVFGERLFGWDSGIFIWVPRPLAPKFVLLLGYIYGLATMLAVLFGGTYLIRSERAELLSLRFGPFKFIPVIAVVAVLWLLVLASFVLLAVRHAGFAQLTMFLFAAICIGLVVTRFWKTDYLHFFGLRSACTVLVLAICPLIYIFAITPFRVPNEFFSLPSKTIFADGTVTDNFAFINSHNIEKLEISDPREKPTEDPLRVTIAGSLSSDIAALDIMLKKYPEQFWYDVASKSLEIHGDLGPRQYGIISRLVDVKDAEKLNKRYARALLEDRMPVYDEPRDKEFLKINFEEFGRQLVLGRFFYHHAFLYQAAVARMHGDPENYSQYGRGFTEFLAQAIKPMPAQLRFNGYLLILYFSYPLYLGMLIWMARKMGLSTWATVFVSAVTLFSFISSDMETVRLGVGLAPWRHIFDLPVLYLLFNYVLRPSFVRATALVLTTAIAMYWSKEMGLFLAVSIVFANMAAWVVSKKMSHAILALCCAVATVIGFLLGAIPGVDSPYALLGTNTPDLPEGFVEVLALIVLAGLAVWFLMRTAVKTATRAYEADWVFLGGTFCYATLCGVYLLWYPRIHHLVPCLPVIGLGLAVAYRGLVLQYRVRTEKIGALSIFAIMLLLLGTVAYRGIELRRESKIFSTHIVEKWDMPGARLTSTAQPQLVESMIDLINKYNPGAALKIISPWEILLMPLAEKYKTGPFPVYFDSLFSKTEIGLVADHILGSPGDVLFVDARIMRGEYEPVVPEDGFLRRFSIASEQRIAAHASLRTLFNVVRPCFDLVEEGRLLSVYRRKANAASMRECTKQSK